MCVDVIGVQELRLAPCTQEAHYYHGYTHEPVEYSCGCWGLTIEQFGTSFRKMISRHVTCERVKETSKSRTPATRGVTRETRMSTLLGTHEVVVVVVVAESRKNNTTPNNAGDSQSSPRRR